MGRLANQEMTNDPQPGAMDRLLESMDDDDDRQMALGWLNDPQCANTWIEGQLRAVGYHISKWSIDRWRSDRGIKSTWAA